MLKLVAILCVLGSGMYPFSALGRPANISKEPQKQPKILSAVRNFEGVIKTVGFFDKMSLWWQDAKDVEYCLYHKNKPIAFLRSPQDVRKKHQLKTLVNRNVCIKGVPQYINKEPYLMILVEDVCP